MDGLLAARSFWGRAPDGPPVPVDLLGHRDRAAATALLRHDLEWLAVDALECHVATAGDADDAVRRLRAAETRVLIDAGYPSGLPLDPRRSGRHRVTRVDDVAGSGSVASRVYSRM